MNKFCGKIGYGRTYEDPNNPGIWINDVVEKKHYGDIIQNGRRWRDQGSINDELVNTNTISILANSFAIDNIHNMLYVEDMGGLWKIESVTLAYPRISITLGGIYHGETPSSTDDSGETS